MITKYEIEKIMGDIHVPQVERSLIEMNVLRDVDIEDSKIKITLSAGAISTEFQERIRNDVQTKFKDLNGAKEIVVTFEQIRPKETNEIKKVVAVMSGKGGVGKSLVTGLLAIAMARQGKAVGILDADITGPSIPKMFGIKSQTSGSDTGFLPVVSRTGIEIMSMNLLLPHEDDAVIWRGPLIGKCITQFWEDVLWGKLDYLMIDLPPGTADVPLTVMKSTPLTGVIIAFSPQDLTAMVVRKAANMARQMNVPILGVVENMSYFLIPETGKKVEIFGRSRGEEMANTCGAPLIAQIPLDPELARLCDEGRIESYNSELFDRLQADAAKVFFKEESTGQPIEVS